VAIQQRLELRGEGPAVHGTGVDHQIGCQDALQQLHRVVPLRTPGPVWHTETVVAAATSVDVIVGDVDPVYLVPPRHQRLERGQHRCRVATLARTAEDGDDLHAFTPFMRSPRNHRERLRLRRGSDDQHVVPDIPKMSLHRLHVDPGRCIHGKEDVTRCGCDLGPFIRTVNDAGDHPCPIRHEHIARFQSLNLSAELRTSLISSSSIPLRPPGCQFAL